MDATFTYSEFVALFVPREHRAIFEVVHPEDGAAPGSSITDNSGNAITDNAGNAITQN
jgi:hypothetical protein